MRYKLLVFWYDLEVLVHVNHKLTVCTLTRTTYHRLQYSKQIPSRQI